MGRSSVWGVTAAAVGLVLVAGCSAGDREDEGQPPAPAPTVTEVGTAPSPTPAPTPTTLSVKEYSARLTKALEPLDAALGRLADAKAYKGLEKRVTDVQGATNRAVTALLPLSPPPGVAQPHRRLTTALEAFATQAGNVGIEVDGRSVCTGALARADLGDARGTSDLRKALAALDDALPGEQPALELPAAGKDPGTRLGNGTYVRDGKRGGRAELEIENGGSADALVTLSKGKKPAIAVYVRKGRSSTVRNVSDGTYTVFFSVGEEWDPAARAFGRDCGFSKFADPMRFRTTRDARGIYWQNFRITLQPVIGGTARTDDVDPDDFPDS